MPGSKFRADHVGSLLRPDSIKAARKAHFEDSTLDAEGLKAVEDEAIADAVAMQEGLGLKVVTDGEYRRSFWHYDFMGALTGLDLVERATDQGLAFQGATLRPIFPTISERIAFPEDHPMLDHFRYVASTSGVTPKISIPGPSCCHFRTVAEDIAPPEYDDLEVLFADVAQAYGDAVQAFYDVGCRYLQMDDIFFAYLCDENQREQKRAIGQDPDWLIEQYAKMMDVAIAGRPDDMTIAMHLCRGNFQSTWVAEGGYDPVADAIFNQTGVDVYFMEYDSSRAGGLAPLGLVPKGDKRVMTGFITTKTAELESIDDVLRRFDEASNHVSIDQLGIAPQCGFASTEEGNKVTADDQKAKLELVLEVAERVWGGVEG